MYKKDNVFNYQNEKHEEYLKWIMPSIKNRSVNPKRDFNFRIEKAKAEHDRGLQMGIPYNKEKHKKEIKKHVNEFLTSIMGMPKIETPEYKPKKTKFRGIKYAEIHPDPTKKEDIVWIKFTKDGFISVIGTGCDIFFTENAMNNTVAGLINQELHLE